MSLKEKLYSDLKEAMRQKDQVRKNTLRLALAAITNVEIAKKKELEDTDMLAVLAKEAKQRQESIKEYLKGGRDDLVAQEKAELAILETYLPQQLSRQEIVKQAKATIEEIGAIGMNDMGSVMKSLMQKLRGQADGKIVNQVVRQLLSEQS
ncbi:MAG: glutamyl-tRNA amidotransferase [Anaerolineaceae bacterium 4572_32.1]|nr:MAG: glutamyl-tRNA amidotransferase [Anaerolineaceae bacterium 4572_32.1]